jgi:hypothetical protein
MVISSSCNTPCIRFGPKCTTPTSTGQRFIFIRDGRGQFVQKIH